MQLLLTLFLILEGRQFSLQKLKPSSLLNYHIKYKLTNSRHVSAPNPAIFNLPPWKIAMFNFRFENYMFTLWISTENYIFRYNGGSGAGTLRTKIVFLLIFLPPSLKIGLETTMQVRNQSRIQQNVRKSRVLVTYITRVISQIP